MRPVRHTWLILSIGLLLSCSESAEVVESSTSDDIETESKFVNDGYVKAVVITKHKMEGCGILLQLEKEETYLQPINLWKDFEKNNLKVWVQYRPIRPAQGDCPARWVNVEAIEKR